MTFSGRIIRLQSRTVVEVSGPVTAADRTLAEVVARTIGGVVQVHV